MIRAVLDTNIVFSAVLKAEGVPAAVFNLVLTDRLLMCVSGPILAEYREVLRFSASFRTSLSSSTQPSLYKRAPILTTIVSSNAPPRREPVS